VYDFDYIEHASLWLDIRLIFCTSLKAVLLCRLPVLKFFRLYREAGKVSKWSEKLLPVIYATARDEDRLSRIMAKRATV
jgi:hypothetical protein